MERLLKFKNFILELADERQMIDCSLVGKESFQYWKYVFDVVESDGYVTDRYNVCGAINPELTEKGRIFFDLGGYSGEKEREKKEKAIDLIKSIVIETLKDVIKHFAVRGILGNQMTM